MRLFHDLDYGFFTTVRGGSAPLRRITFKAGDSTTLELEFFRSGVACVPASLDEAIFVIKDSYAPDAAPLALVETEDWSADSDSDEESETFTATLNTNTEEIRDALADAGSITLKAELTVTLDGLGPETTATVPCVIENDLWKGDEATPLPLPTPEEWLGAHAVRYDEAQTLSDPEKAQAIANIGAETPTGAATQITAASYLSHLSAAAGPRTFLLTDHNKLIRRSFATAMTDTIPRASTTAFPDGWYCSLRNDGVADLTITPATGVSLEGDPLLVPGDMRSLIRLGVDNFEII